MAILWEDVRYLEVVERIGSVGGAARVYGTAAAIAREPEPLWVVRVLGERHEPFARLRIPFAEMQEDIPA